jgi:glycosyltransferase involved in cell wall biosynthesis
MKKLSLVVPVYYEQEVILQFLKETKIELDKLPIIYEYIFVDDGSKDRTIDIIKEQAKTDDRIKLVVFSYNQGKAFAVSAAIAHASGDYLLYMDPDLQDPPHEITRFLDEIEKGYDLVWGVRRIKKDSFINVIFSKFFWKILRRYTGLQIPNEIAVMRMFNREFANEFLRFNEANRFIEGIFITISKKYTTIEIEQRKRFAGKTKFNFSRKLKLAFDAIFDFSELPLQMTVKSGMIIIGIGLMSIFSLLIIKLFYIDFQTGWASIISIIITIFGIQLFFMGIISLYIGRIYKEVKQRPLYSIKEKIGFE